MKKYILITGACSGIGAATKTEFDYAVKYEAKR